MSEMIGKFFQNIRTVNFQHPQPLPQVVASPPAADTKGHRLSVIATTARRGSLLEPKMGPGPGPGDYHVPDSTLQQKGVSFKGQSGRTDAPLPNSDLPDVGPNLDRIRPRSSQAIPFAKQSGRDSRKPAEDPFWDEIEHEQDRILQKFAATPKKSAREKGAKSSFMLQTPQVDHPFAHIMRDETDIHYDVEASRKALDRPTPAFNIRQPAFKSAGDRYEIRRSDAPDLMYDNVKEQFTKTKPRTTSPLPIDREIPRCPPYDYLPHGCGCGDFLPPDSTFLGKPSVDIGKLGKRKTRLETQGNFKRALHQGIPRNLSPDNKS
jgi:hypothetical protein